MIKLTAEDIFYAHVEAYCQKSGADRSKYKFNRTDEDNGAWTKLAKTDYLNLQNIQNGLGVGIEFAEKVLIILEEKQRILNFNNKMTEFIND